MINLQVTLKSRGFQDTETNTNNQSYLHLHYTSNKETGAITIYIFQVKWEFLGSRLEECSTRGIDIYYFTIWKKKIPPSREEIKLIYEFSSRVIASRNASGLKLNKRSPLMKNVGVPRTPASTPRC